MYEPPFKFVYDERLEMERPILLSDYEDMTVAEQEEFEEQCQIICGRIPEQIRSFERRYMHSFDLLATVEHDEIFEQIIHEMNELSSCISDLNLLYLYIEGTFLDSGLHA